MARNGAGVYSNPYPNFVNGTVISSDQADANNAAIGTALTQSIAVDGQTTITANLPMNSKKFTGLAVGTAATDSLTLGQAQAQAFAWGGTAGGGADAITISPTPAITAYAVGQKFFWIASGSANTGAATIAISGLTAIAMQDGGAALAAGVHAAGKVFMGVLNTTSTVQIMQVQSSGDPLTISALTVNGTSQFSGAIIQGVNGTGYDATFFGDTPGAYLMWDQSADKLLTAGGALVDIVKDKLMIGGTAVTTTAAELNFNDTATAGTVVASKTVVASADKDIASFRNITLTGELDAGSLDISGIADIAGTTTVVALTASGVVTANANIDLNGTELILDADADTSITADTDDTIDIRIAGADDFQFTANTLTCVSGSTLATNTISETTAASGVTIDGLLIKDSKIELADGTAALPSLSNSGDVNTGIAFLEADTVSVTTGGVEQFRFGSNPIPGEGKNLIDNGSFLVAQRGTSFTGVAPADTDYSLDRWFSIGGYGTPADRYTISQVATAAGALLDGFPKAIRAETTTAETSPDVNRYSSPITQKVELSTARQLGYGAAGAKFLTVSFWARSSQTGLHGIGLGMNNGGAVNPQTYSVTSADTWEKMSVTFSPNTSAAIATTEYGLALFFLAQLGTTADNGTQDTWGSQLGYTPIADIAGATSRYIEISGVQAEVGKVATSYAHKSYGTELLACWRYFRVQDMTNMRVFGGTYDVNANTASGPITFPVQMRAAPTIAFNGDYRLVGGGAVTDTSVGHGASYVDSSWCLFYFTSGSLAANGWYGLLRESGTCNITYSADL